MNNDLISRKALRKVLSDPLYRSTIKDYGEILKYTFVMDIIDNAPTVDTYTEDDVQEAIKAGYQVGYELPKAKFERPQEWIPVSERLPKYNKTVLISVKQKGKENNVFTAQRRKRFKTPDIFECCMDNDGWWDFRVSAWDDHEVIAWMPLPEPYKETDNEKD